MDQKNNKLNIKDIAKTLDKLFLVGFDNDKSILSMTMEDLGKLPDLSATDMNIIINLKKAIKSKKIIAFLASKEEQ